MPLKKLGFGFKKTILVLIRLYQIIFSPGRGIFKVSYSSVCRFYPSCSEYGYEVIKRFGFLKGSWLAVRRILKCHPFCEGGWDPAPKR